MKNLQEYIGEQLAYPDKGVPFNPTKLNKTGLVGTYELICEEYRRRLCELWDYNLDDSYWLGDVVGESLFVGDWIWALDMTQIIYCVNNNVSCDAIMEYQSFVEDELSAGRNYPRINFRSWFELNCRPEMLKD